MIKQAAASTHNRCRCRSRPAYPASWRSRPKGLKIALTFDQSVFVKAALWDVLQEGVTAAVLVALMVLVFVGSARSMLIVITSIPLAILTSIIVLNLFGQTINTMTLGGLALAVGMLVDDATVEVENIHRNHTPGKPLVTAILEGAAQIATPTLVGTLSICVVFFPVVLLSGVARYLFPPLALAVVAAMLTSYLLSRTLVPAMAIYLLPDLVADRSVLRPRRPFPYQIRTRLRPRQGSIQSRSGSFHSTSAARPDRRGCDDRGFAAAVLGGGPGFLSECRYRTDAASRPRTHRDPDRIDGVPGQQNRSRYPARNSRQPARNHQRQYRDSAVLTFSPITQPTVLASRTRTS